jgi:uncharacterized protein (TIGR02145 family)
MKKSLFPFFNILLVLLIFSSCGNNSTNEKDRNNSKGTDGETIIGSQTWATENLKTIVFMNGDTIPETKTVDEWRQAGYNKIPAWCYYDNDPANDKYGKLYNWYAVNDPRGLSPKGWHIPSDREWGLLADHLGGANVAGKKIKNEYDWLNHGGGSNESGFSGLPGGLRRIDGAFSGIGEAGFWWCSNEINNSLAWACGIYSDADNISRYDNDKINGLAIRCVKD